MKKWFLSVVLVFVMVVCLTGCEIDSITTVQTAETGTEVIYIHRANFSIVDMSLID